MTSSAGVHHKLVDLGFDLPTYTYTSETADAVELGFSLWWHCSATLETSSGPFEGVAKAASKKSAKTEASVILLAKVIAGESQPVGVLRQPDPPLVREGFLTPVSSKLFSPGEVKELKEFVRPLGLQYVFEAVRYYQVLSHPVTSCPAPGRLERTATIDPGRDTSSSTSAIVRVSLEGDSDNDIPAMPVRECPRQAPLDHHHVGLTPGQRVIHDHVCEICSRVYSHEHVIKTFEQSLSYGMTCPACHRASRNASRLQPCPAQL